MYIIIKRDKAEHLKEKLHHISAIAEEVLECMEEAAERRYERDYEGHRDMARHHDEGYYPDERSGYPAEREVYRHHELARRGRGRY